MRPRQKGSGPRLWITYLVDVNTLFLNKKAPTLASHFCHMLQLQSTGGLLFTACN